MTNPTFTPNQTVWSFRTWWNGPDFNVSAITCSTFAETLERNRDSFAHNEIFASEEEARAARATLVD